jgi:hypothetical protein
MQGGAAMPLAAEMLADSAICFRTPPHVFWKLSQ